MLLFRLLGPALWLALGLGLGREPLRPPGEKIAVTAGQVEQRTGGQATAAALFDGRTDTPWFPGWNAADYPARAIVDLGAVYRLTYVRIYDGTGTPTLTFGATEEPYAAGQPFLSVKLDRYLSWYEQPVTVTTRYLLLELAGMEGDQAVGEIELFGQKVGAAERTAAQLPAAERAAPAAPLRRHAGAAAQIGINGFHWVPLELVQPFALLREYQMSSWTWTRDGLMVQPSFQGNANYDDHYRALKEAGITVIPCVNKIPEWLLDGRTEHPEWSDFKPVRPAGAKPTDPVAYRDISAYFFQLAARYGRQKWPDKLLRVNTAPRWPNDPPNEVKSGLDLLQYIEVENEPNRWWRSAEARYTPEEYAAMLSACYDGHEGRLGAGHGIKTADPTMQVVMAGLANLNRPYLEQMLAWFRANRRDRQFAADVLNVHHYSNQGNSELALEVAFTVGITPEADHLREKLRALLAWRDRTMPGKPLWFSEFGYDTNAPSVQRVTPYGRHSAEQVQGAWLARGYLEALAAGCDAVFAFNAIDENAAHTGGLYTSSGLAYGEKPLAAERAFQKKASWQIVADLIAALEGYTFAEDLSTAPDVRLYAFDGAAGRKVIGWSATASDAQVTMNIGGERVVLTEWPRVVVPTPK
jgi:hypothetical protein